MFMNRMNRINKTQSAISIEYCIKIVTSLRKFRVICNVWSIICKLTHKNVALIRAHEHYTKLLYLYIELYKNIHTVVL